MDVNALIVMIKEIKNIPGTAVNVPAAGRSETKSIPGTAASAPAAVKSETKDIPGTAASAPAVGRSETKSIFGTAVPALYAGRLATYGNIQERNLNMTSRRALIAARKTCVLWRSSGTIFTNVLNAAQPCGSSENKRVENA